MTANNTHEWDILSRIWIEAYEKEEFKIPLSSYKECIRVRLSLYRMRTKIIARPSNHSDKLLWAVKGCSITIENNSVVIYKKGLTRAGELISGAIGQKSLAESLQKAEELLNQPSPIIEGNLSDADLKALAEAQPAPTEKNPYF